MNYDNFSRSPPADRPPATPARNLNSEDVRESLRFRRDNPISPFGDREAFQPRRPRGNSDIRRGADYHEGFDYVRGPGDREGRNLGRGLDEPEGPIYLDILDFWDAPPGIYSQFVSESVIEDRRRTSSRRPRRTLFPRETLPPLPGRRPSSGRFSMTVNPDELEEYDEEDPEYLREQPIRGNIGRSARRIDPSRPSSRAYPARDSSRPFSEEYYPRWPEDDPLRPSGSYYTPPGPGPSARRPGDDWRWPQGI
ncbi:hypothetical protein F5X68DRAFT_234938 [Plectosphaerella plurivora]|uniref:Uncharacterized protein n=1 Tax=Plectosphaerella plurivora TaxID=936078 RepID=A0A9P8V6J2_9PEZI|nr:hypothetical protein F5X68DRAFT_234938 [Plectosphaerella plurivora]